MMRSIITVLVGLLLGRITTGLLGLAGSALYPAPAGLAAAGGGDLSGGGGGGEAWAQFLASAPTGMFLALLIAGAGGAFVGGLVAALLSERRRTLHALAVGAVQTALAVVQFRMVPHPFWFMVLGVTVLLPVAALAGLLVGREPDST
jgi:hypothetical protein